MSRLEGCFDELRSSGRKALIPYVTAGDPAPDVTVALMHALVDAGADAIELGVPFSDPMADGPVIQLACERALRHGTSLRRVLRMVGEFRRRNDKTPVVLMGYLNPVESMGYETFAQSAAEAGVDGVLLVDLIAEEAAETAATLRRHGLDPVFLVAPTTSEARLERIAGLAAGYLYYVSLKGVTGSDRIDVDSLAQRVEALHHASRLPVAVGFGIRDAATAAQVAAVADGVIVGSALVSRVAELQKDHERLLREVPAVLADMRRAMDDAGAGTVDAGGGRGVSAP